MNSYAIYNINRNCWLQSFNTDQVSHGPEPKIFFKTNVELSKFAQETSDKTGDELKIYRLIPNGAVFTPSLTSRMGKYTNVFSPKVAEFIHNVAKRLGNSIEDKLEAAKVISEEYNNALKNDYV